MMRNAEELACCVIGNGADPEDNHVAQIRARSHQMSVILRHAANVGVPLSLAAVRLMDSLCSRLVDCYVAGKPAPAFLLESIDRFCGDFVERCRKHQGAIRKP
jgi:hypothetical protein